MGIIHYSAQTNSSAQIEQMKKHLISGGFDLKKIDFPFNIQWAKMGYLHASDYAENRHKYDLCSNAFVLAEEYKELPQRFKGAVVDLDKDCDPLRLVFGEYSDDRWICRQSMRTHNAQKEFDTHIGAIAILRGVESLIDNLWVQDETGLWESGNVEVGYQGYQASRQRMRELSLLLKREQLARGDY